MLRCMPLDISQLGLMEQLCLRRRLIPKPLRRECLTHFRLNLLQCTHSMGLISAKTQSDRLLLTRLQSLLLEFEIKGGETARWRLRVLVWDALLWWRYRSR